MLRKITQSLAWTATLFRSSAAAQSVVQHGLDARILNQTPLNLANAVLTQLTEVPPIENRLQQSSQSRGFGYPNRNAQPNIDGLAGYLEYFLAAVVAIPVAVVAFPLLKRTYRSLRHTINSWVTTESQHEAVIRVKRTRPSSLPSIDQSKTNVDTNATHAAGTSTSSSVHVEKKDDVLLPKKRPILAKTSVRQAMTSDIRDKLEKRRLAAAAAKLAAISAPLPERTPRVRRATASVLLSSPPSRLVARLAPVVDPLHTHPLPRALSTSSAQAAQPVSSPLSLNHKTVRERLNIVSEDALHLADFTGRFNVDGEEKLDDAALRIRHLLALFRLHRYNLSVLEFMHHHRTFQTSYYESLNIPLRRDLAHYSEDYSPQDVMATMENLRVVLDNYAEASDAVSQTDVRHLISSINPLLENTPLGQKCKHTRKLETENKTKFQKDKTAHEAYTHFVNNFIPEMKVLAAKIKTYDKRAEPVFSYEDYLQAFGMLIMMSCDRLPTHVLTRLRKNSEAYPANIVSFMSKVRNVRNIIAHRLEQLPEVLVTYLCDDVLRMSGGSEVLQTGMIEQPKLIRAASSPQAGEGDSVRFFSQGTPKATRAVQSDPVMVSNNSIVPR
jgi:hypothetical protein